MVLPYKLDDAVNDDKGHSAYISLTALQQTADSSNVKRVRVLHLQNALNVQGCYLAGRVLHGFICNVTHSDGIWVTPEVIHISWPH